jgi:hypothetical protein
LSTVSRDLGQLWAPLDTAHKARHVGALNLMAVRLRLLLLKHSGGITNVISLIIQKIGTMPEIIIPIGSIIKKLDP